MLQPGVVPSLFCSLTLSSLYQPAPCPLSFFFLIFIILYFGGITSHLPLLCEPFLLVLSVTRLYRTDSFLLYPAYIFFHLPPCLSPSSIALSPDAQESVNWLQEHELDV